MSAKQFLIGVDQLLNTVVWIKGDGFGYADETLSARAWRLRKQSNAWKRIDRLFWFDKDHCRTSYIAELRRKHLPKEYQVMAYFSYSQETGALLSISDFDIPLTDGTVVSAAGGLTKVQLEASYDWDAGNLQFVPKSGRMLSKLSYMNRFTDDELAGIYTAAKVNVYVEVWLAKFNAASGDINLDDARTIAGVQALEGVGLIGPGRAAEILA